MCWCDPNKKTPNCGKAGCAPPQATTAPAEVPMPEDDMSDALGELAGVDTHDVNLRDNPESYEILGRLLRTYGAACRAAGEAAGYARGLAEAGSDAKRYRFITDDHADADVRRAVAAVCDAIVIRGKGATDAAIDALREKTKPAKCDGNHGGPRCADPECWNDGPIALILDELRRAVTKFPTWPTDPLHALAVLGEEFGELTKATLQTTYEPHKSSHDDVRTEAIQTAAMALRFVISLERYEYTQGIQHQQEGQPA